MQNNKQRENMRLKGLIRFYKPYLNIFLADMLFAIIAAGVTLVVPLIVRHITSTVVHLPMEAADYPFWCTDDCINPNRTWMQLLHHLLWSYYGHIY